jgi:endonuclease YncB( thermonuclease family)
VNTARLLAFLAVLLGAVPAGLHSQDLDHQIRSEVASYLKLLSRGKPEQVAALYTRTTTPTSLGDGQVSEGRGAITELYRRFFEAAGKAQLVADSVHVVSLGESSALAWFRFHWVRGGAGGGVISLVFVREGSRWAILHDHMSLASVTTDRVESPRPAYGGPPRPARSSESCLVSKIVDGDTIACEPVGRIRLIGIDTPETDQPPYGATAARGLARLIPIGSRITLEPDVTPRDRYGRVLAYLWYEGQLVNWWMVREGWAVAYRYEPDVRWADLLTRAETTARGEKRGLWAVGGFTCMPSDHRRKEC